MKEFFKTLLKGLAVVVLFPIWLPVLIIFIIFICFNFFCCELIFWINFFRGFKSSDDKYSILLEKAKQESREEKTTPAPTPVSAPTPVPSVIIINTRDGNLTPEQVEFMNRKTPYLEQHEAEVIDDA